MRMIRNVAQIKCINKGTKKFVLSINLGDVANRWGGLQVRGGRYYLSANGNDKLEGLIKTRPAGRCEIVEME